MSKRRAGSSPASPTNLGLNVLMKIYPSIDILKGQAVRLEQGDFDRCTDYGSAVAHAKRMESQGIREVHIVDLEYVKSNGKYSSIDIIEEIAKTTSLKIQIGGGIRNLKKAQQMLGFCSEVVLGSVFFTDEEATKEILSTIDHTQVVVSIDFSNGKPAIHGWLQHVNKSDQQIEASLKKIGVTTIIVSDIDRDGLLQGPDIGLFSKWVDKGFRVIASGGIATQDDISNLASLGVDGVIIGRSYYENKIDLSQIG